MEEWDRDDDDDWLFASIKLYKQLYMYNLQFSITAMGWIGDASLCVTTSNGSKHELVELCLPERLTVNSAEDASLMKNRDFQMAAGGFTDHPISSVKQIPQTRAVVTSPRTKDCCVEFYQLGSDETDMIKKIQNFRSEKPKGCCAQVAVHGECPTVVFGSHQDNLCHADVSSGQDSVIGLNQNDSSKISSMAFVDSNTLMTCCQETGNIYELDIRENKLKVKFENKNLQKNCGSYWTAVFGSDYTTEVSDVGDIFVLDRRKMDTPIKTLHTDIPMKPHTECSHLSLQVCGSGNSQKLHVTGFDDKVYIYDDILQGSDPIKPVFIHEGHPKNSDQSQPLTVVSHMLHPTQKVLNLSAATDGSLHAWEYNVSTSIFT